MTKNYSPKSTPSFGVGWEWGRGVGRENCNSNNSRNDIRSVSTSKLVTNFTFEGNWSFPLFYLFLKFPDIFWEYLEFQRLFARSVFLIQESRLFFFYGAETWRTTVTTTKMIQAFVNRCLRRIVGVWWSEIISNERLWQQRTCQMPVEQEIR